MKTFNITIGGEAGQGLVSVGNILLKAIVKEGWYLFANQDYESRIRGGHNLFQFCISDKPVFVGEPRIDVLVALDEVSMELHQADLADDGVVIYDPTITGELTGRPNLIRIPFAKITEEQHQPRVMANVVAAGAIWALLSDSLTVLDATLTKMFGAKGEEIVNGNKGVAKAGFDLVEKALGKRLKPAKPNVIAPRMILKGNEALPAGALAAGLKFMSAYPMTPSTGVTEFVATHGEKCSVIMEQTEDEISAVNMAVGAAFAGVRAMTATSGGGFALMTEALGLAGSAEIPLVVINAQRPGPSTGLPTRTEQGDLLYGYGMSSGDFPKALLAPGDVEEAFYLMGHAFNLAEQYQMPVVVFSDQHLADSYQTVAPFDLTQIEIKRGSFVAREQAGLDYKRYRYTESGVSPRMYPGFGEGFVVSAGDEHDEEGHLIEDIATRVKMMEKRMAKMQGVLRDALAPVTYGDDQPDIVLIGWGSTKGAIRSAVEILQEQGTKALAIHLPQVYPLPAELEQLLAGPGEKYVVEGNFSGQLQKLLGMEFAWKPAGSVRRFDGRPLNAHYILERLAGGAYYE